MTKYRSEEDNIKVKIKYLILSNDMYDNNEYNDSSVQLLSHVWLFGTPWTAASPHFFPFLNWQVGSLPLAPPWKPLYMCNIIHYPSPSSYFHDVEWILFVKELSKKNKIQLFEKRYFLILYISRDIKVYRNYMEIENVYPLLWASQMALVKNVPAM